MRNNITPHLFENYLIIAFDSKWIELFGKIPTFSVEIDSNKRLHLISNEAIANVQRE